MAITNNPNTINTIDAFAYNVSASGVIAVGVVVSTSSNTAVATSITSTIATGPSIFGAGEVLNNTLNADLVVNPTINGSASVLRNTSTGTMYTTNSIIGNAHVLLTFSDSQASFNNNITGAAYALLTTLSANVTSGANQVITTPPDTDYPFITGNEYLIVNLKNKAHCTYRDGSNQAMVMLPNLMLGSSNQKNVSDIYINSRATNASEVIVINEEESERIYPLTYESTLQAKLANKKLPIAKGLSGTNWQISIALPADAFMEVRSMELLVTDFKRRVS